MELKDLAFNLQAQTSLSTQNFQILALQNEMEA